MITTLFQIKSNSLKSWNFSFKVNRTFHCNFWSFRLIHAFLLTDCFSVRPLSAVQAVLKLLFRRYLFRNGGRPFGNFLLALWHYIHCVYWNWYCGNFVLCNLFLSTSVNNNKQITIRIIQGGSDWPAITHQLPPIFCYTFYCFISDALNRHIAF